MRNAKVRPFPIPFTVQGKHAGRARTVLVIAAMLVTFCPMGSAEQPERADQTNAKSKQQPPSTTWPFWRGDPQSSGATNETLPNDLDVLWEFKADEAIETTPVISDGRVFVSDVLGKVYALQQSDGEEIWRKDYDTGFLASPAINGDRLVIGDVEGNLYCLNTADGTEIWKSTTEGEINGSAAFYNDWVLVTSQDGKLYCFRMKDGKSVWVYQTDDQVRCSPSIAGDRTFLGGCDGQLHVVDLKTGQAVKEPLPLEGPTGSTPSVARDHVYVPIMDGVVLAFDWKKHEQIWRYEDENHGQEYRNSAAVAGPLLVVSSQYKQVDGVSTRTGKRIWRYTLRRRADASPVIAGNDVWIAATDGRLIRLSLTDGKEQWQYEIRGAFIAGPAIASGRLYIADDEGVVRCFGPKK